MSDSKKSKEPKKADYATNLPGDKPYDEARRATADLCRLARMWVGIAESYEDARQPTMAFEFDDDRGEERLVSAPDAGHERRSAQEEYERTVREHWQLWEQGMERAKAGITSVPDRELEPLKVDAKLAMMRLVRIFFPPIFLLRGEEPGDHLLRPAGPMAWHPDGRCNLQRDMVYEIVEPLADFSDLMVMYDPKAKIRAGFDPKADSGWTAQRLQKRIDGGHTFMATLRGKAVPPVPPRIRFQPYKWGELLRMADVAEARKDLEAAGNLRTIVTSQESPH